MEGTLGGWGFEFQVSLTLKVRVHFPSSSEPGGEITSESDRLKEKFPEYERYGKKMNRAVEAVLAGGVKEARFAPSGRSVITIVGRLGDEFIDPERPYCSCSNFYFRVMTGREDVCYHLLSYKIAVDVGMVDLTEFSDEEYGSYISAAVNDVFEVLRKSGGS